MFSTTDCLVLLGSLSSLASATCTNFTATGNESLNTARISTNGSILSPFTFVVSDVVKCSSSSRVDPSCTLKSFGWVTDYTTLNISKSTSYPLNSSSNMGLNPNYTGHVPSISGQVPNGRSQHFVFNAKGQCHWGVLSGCDGDGEVQDGTAVEACVAVFTDKEADEFGWRNMDGSTEAVDAMASSGDRFSCNPANSTKAREGDGAGNCESAYEGKEEGAGAMITISTGLLALGFCVAFSVL
ncbi:hypothetical protein D6D06_03435 [Aureobasidium pullulans]|nr:hypothetical protein D6D06_03435 [Aureobasidium pullulans]